MNLHRHLPLIVGLGLMAAPFGTSWAQCTNANQYPGQNIIPDAGGALTTISTCSFTTEYSQIENIVAGATYQFTIDGGFYITVHQGTYDGPVLGQGTSPVTISAATNENLFAHWTMSAACDGMSSCQVTTVQLFLNCTPPSFTTSTVNDCDNSQFYINVDITSIGDAGTVAMTYTVDNGPATTLPGNGPGSYQLGPFPNLSLVDLTVEHDSDPMCNQTREDITNLIPCPVLSCGPDNYTYCYQNNDFYSRVFQGTSTYPLRLEFNSGTIYQWDGDIITIYDGLTDAAPVLYTGTGINGNMTGINVTSTNAQYALCVKLTSTAFTSCGDGFTSDLLDYTVGCLDCTPATATFDVQLDCENDQFYVVVAITEIGTDAELDIANNAGAPTLQATQPGEYLVGPFADGTDVQVELQNSQNLLCNVTSPVLTNSPCPEISCGPDNYIYCYPDVWDSVIVYQSENTYPIAFEWNDGQMEWCCDNFTIYDGDNELAPVLYSGNNNGQNLNALEPFISNNPDNALLVKFHSDGSVNCQNQGYPPLNWTVSCLDCTSPVASFERIPDCVHNGYLVEVTVDSLGVNAPYLQIVNTYNSDTVTNVMTNTYVLGPFPVDTVVQLTVLNANNPLCKVVSEPFTWSSDSCVNYACLPTGVEYCYQNADTAFFTFASGTTEPITINFLYGQLLVNDYIQVYNGLDTSAQLIYMGNNGGQIGGFAINSSNPDNALTLLVISSQAGACANGEANPIYWSVGCGLVGVDEFEVDGFALFPNPTNGEVYIRLDNAVTGAVNMEVLDVSGRLLVSERFNASTGLTKAFDLSGLQNGNYMVRLSTPAWSKSSVLQVVR